MIRTAAPLLVVALLFSLAYLGCSEDTVVPVDNEQRNPSGLVEGSIDAFSNGFEITTDTAGDPSRPIAGPFIIRGKNVHYVDSLSALSVDITVEHRCECWFPEPIGLTFINLLPQGVTVENPDNDQHGPGAAIVFGFANDDARWTAGEESFPRTVLFGVDADVSIGFVARIDIGMDPDLGSVGGVVWNDLNENGQLDPAEPGIGGVVINMYRTDGREDAMPPEILWRTVTAPDGSYRFDGLEAGHYELKKLPRDDLRSTTPSVMQVILVDEGGTVSDFLMANFGCVTAATPRPVIDVGDFVDVWGDHAVRPEDHVVSKAIQLTRCDNSWSGAGPASRAPATDEFSPCDLPLGALVGPVTGINREESVMWVMGTPIRFLTLEPATVLVDPAVNPPIPRNVAQPPGEEVGFDDVNVGDRVTVFAIDHPDHRTLDGVKIYLSRDDNVAADVRVHGKVDELLMTTAGTVGAFVSMRTTVVVTDLTRIRVVE